LARQAWIGFSVHKEDHVGFIDEKTRAIFGRSYAAEPDVLVEQLKKDEAITEADTLLLTVPNQLGVAYDAHVIEAILTHVAPALGWRWRLSPRKCGLQNLGIRDVLRLVELSWRINVKSR
jgi:hypothetical protein